jgi:hypothetical protein
VIGRTQLTLDAFGEHVTENHITSALTTICNQQQWRIVHFHVAPLTVNTNTGQVRGRHEWWLELKPGTVSTPTGPQIAASLDAELQR